MSLQDLPVELLQAILCEAIKLRGIKRGLRLRLVSRVFANEVIDTLFAYQLLDAHFASLRGSPSDKARLHWPPFTEAYLEFRVLNESEDGYEPLVYIRRIAEELCRENNSGILDSTAYRERVKFLCHQAIVGPSNAGDYSYKMANMFSTDLRTTEMYYSTHLFAAAVACNSLRTMERLLEGTRSRSPCYSWIFGHSIRIAAQNGYHDMLEVLLNRTEPGTQLSMSRNKAFITASRAGRPETVQFVFQLRRQDAPWRFEGKESSGTYDQPLSAAMSTPSKDTLETVVELQKKYSVKKSIWQDEVDSLTSRLYNAAREGWTDMARYLVELGARPDGIVNDLDSDYRPVIYACQAGNIDIVRLLVDAKADTRRAISHAARHGHLEIVQMLLDAAADIKDGLAKAAEGGYMDIVRLLVDRGADVKDVDAKPHPLVSAIGLEHTELFKYLIEKGGKETSDDVAGQCLKRARAEGLESMLALLKEHGIPSDPTEE